MSSTEDSKASSRASTSQPSSIKSGESPDRSPVLVPQNGANGSVKEPADPAPRQAERVSVKDRFSRMFLKEPIKSTDNVAAINKKPAAAAAMPPTSQPSSSSPALSQPPSRKPSNPEKATDVANSHKASAKPARPSSSKDSSARFVVDPSLPGGHEHHLKSSRRQEKLGDLWRAMLGRKQEHPENDLSLVSGWVDMLKREKESAAGSDGKKLSPSSSTLIERYGKCQEVVGRGAFGVVRISHKKMSNGGGEKLYAVKEFRRRPEETEKKYSKRLTSEFCISSSLRHPNIIHTLDLLQDAKGDYCEVMEFCAGGDLYTLVLSAGKLEVQEADCFFKQLMRGVEYMHEMGVAHRDLKPENLLLTPHGALKITDFGNGECFRMAWEADAHMVSGLCGSAPYIAPEEYIDREFDPRAIDVWACGVIYMAMRTGRHLWRVAKRDEDEFYERYLEGRRDEEGYGPIESLHRVGPNQDHCGRRTGEAYGKRCGAKSSPYQARCRNVIYSILDPNPTRRITASQVLKSEWGREIKLCRAGEEGL